jgi:hypothetical protein
MASRFKTSSSVMRENRMHPIKMVIVSPTELRPEQKKYLDMAEKEDVVVEKDSKPTYPVVRERPSRMKI